MSETARQGGGSSARQGGTPRAERPTGSLALDLTGDLPCASCGYNLRGLSVRANCPECSVPVRATILARIDPRATEIQPIPRPQLVAAGVMCWSLGALAAALFTWMIQIAHVAELMRGAAWNVGWCPEAGVLAMLVSGLGSLAVVRPHAGIPARNVVLAMIAAGAYVPLAWLHWQIVGVLDAVAPPPYFAQSGIVEELVFDRLCLRLAMSGVMAVMVLCLRPNLRLLVARSLVLRTGRVDRQTMYAVLASVAVIALGDTMGLLAAVLRGPIGDLTAISSLFLVAVGSMLLTIALTGLVIDSWRLMPVLLRRPLALGDVFGGDEPESPEGGR
ncbi:MAG: hypothetical protein DYG93_02020 [Leptolyngbya sp. PLA2]|nr:hypothetical protein [Leptolyngbya sp. PL-A2]MCQ3941009.1 hypothetical protein [cyanobacterium CYA1]MCZ7633117.1 hypothetical protein [Phycisphaerales bacterium]MDL1905602.1 hypothetical protein [Synechococcales cyanobacterium CNB]GIK18825.1 MAG: hypothetical protein BroJett004_09890 [Planctomycetota bacterium]